jgi:hypothetical protein
VAVCRGSQPGAAHVAETHEADRLHGQPLPGQAAWIRARLTPPARRNAQRSGRAVRRLSSVTPVRAVRCVEHELLHPAERRSWPSRAGCDPRAEARRGPRPRHDVT